MATAVDFVSERFAAAANFAEAMAATMAIPQFSSRLPVAEISECGVALDLGESDGFGEAVSLGVVDGGPLKGFGVVRSIGGGGCRRCLLF